MSKSFFESTTINVNNISSQVEIPILCPNHSRGCKSEEIVKNGHDTSVKEHPQYFHCKNCNISFYAHTSAFLKEVELQLPEVLVNFFASGKFNMDGLQSTLNCSKPTISRLFQQVINAVNASKQLIELWTAPKSARALFVDETWINIDRQVFYLIVVVNEQKEVLAWELINIARKNELFRF